MLCQPSLVAVRNYKPAAVRPPQVRQSTDVRAGRQPAAVDGTAVFGLVDIDGQTGQMTVRLMDRDDNEPHKVTLDPADRSPTLAGGGVTDP